MQRAYVIADIGACHDGDPTKMVDAIAEAAAAGADAVKFQWTSDPDRMAARRGKAAEHGYAEVYRRYLAFPHAQLAQLAHVAAVQEVDFMCTAFLPEDVAQVLPLVKHAKVASFEASDCAMLEAHRAWLDGRDRRLFVSLGMGQRPYSASACPASHEHSKRWLAGIEYLHCVSAYPAPADALNLRVLTDGLINSASEDPAPEVVEFAGFSDHSESKLTGAFAVCAGATVLERHLRLHQTDPGNPDFPHALAPPQFYEYVQHVRMAERMLGDGERRRHESEGAMAQYLVGGAK